MSEESLTIRDVMRELDASDKTIRRWIQSGELIARVDVLGRYRISRADLDDFIRRRTQRRERSTDT